jgi:hypothetical protein
VRAGCTRSGDSVAPAEDSLLRANQPPESATKSLAMGSRTSIATSPDSRWKTRPSASTKRTWGTTCRRMRHRRRRRIGIRRTVVGEDRPPPIHLLQPFIWRVVRRVSRHGGAHADDVQAVGDLTGIAPLVEHRNLGIAVWAPVGEQHHHRRAVGRRIDGDPVAVLVDTGHDRHLLPNRRIVNVAGLDLTGEFR